MIFQCTQKLLKELHRKPDDLTFLPGVGCWHVNLLSIQRRKLVLFTHNQSLFSIVIPNMKRKDFEQIEFLFGEILFKTLMLFDFEQREIEKLLNLTHQYHFVKTDSPSVLGSMNDLAYQIEGYIVHDGGIDTTDWGYLHQRINEIPYQAISSGYAWKELKNRLSN